MAIINPYLNFSGNTEEAFNFYRSVFGGEFQVMMRFKNMPDGQNLSAEDGEKLMHISLPISKTNVLMGTDVLGSMGQSLTVGNNFALSVHTASEAETEKIFNGLSEGGQVTMPLQKTFWSALFGMLTDKFGTQWMISFDNNEQE
ncbi:VOC family protein [Mucilaginibacter sp. AW1-3]